MRGTVLRIFKDKGYGFIRGENNIEHFFHHSGVRNIRFDELEEGQDVTFESTEGTKGPRAEEIYV